MRTRTLALALACAAIFLAFAGTSSASTLMGGDLSLSLAKRLRFRVVRR